MNQAIPVHTVGKDLIVSCVTRWKKLQHLKSDILTKFITFTDYLIEIPKTKHILQNVINIGNITLAVPKSSFVIWLTIIKVLTINLRTKSSKEALREKKVPQILNYSSDHNDIQDWVITLTEQVNDTKLLRQRKHVWAYKLDTFYPNSLLITRILFNLFSHREDTSIFMYIYLHILLLFTLTNNYIFFKNCFNLSRFYIAIFGIFLWYSSLASDDISLINCRGH